MSIKIKHKNGIEKTGIIIFIQIESRCDDFLGLLKDELFPWRMLSESKCYSG